MCDVRCLHTLSRKRAGERARARAKEGEGERETRSRSRSLLKYRLTNAISYFPACLHLPAIHSCCNRACKLVSNFMKRPVGKSAETPAEKAEKVRQAAAAVAKSRQERLQREEEMLVQARQALAAADTSSAADKAAAATVRWLDSS